jgi:Flp pilus assembly protein TadB
MTGQSTVTDPEGKAWTVRRRWFPWRRALSVRSIWHSTPDSDKPDDDATPANEDAGSKSSGNPVLNAILTIVGLLLWLVVTAGKAVLILLAAVVVITLSLADFILQLLVMPFVLLARVCGVMRWPVQVEREHRFVRTEFADGFDSAAVLRDDLSTQIQRGELIAEPVKS